jgi:hypothetical protein
MSSSNGSGNGNGRGTLILDLARQATPIVNPIQAMRKQLALAVYDNVKEQDISEMMSKLKEMALGGDLNAMKMWMKLTIGDGNEKAPKEETGVQALAEAVSELVDEIRIAKAEPPRSKTKKTGRLLEAEDDED